MLLELSQLVNLFYLPRGRLCRVTRVLLTISNSKNDICSLIAIFKKLINLTKIERSLISCNCPIL